MWLHIFFNACKNVLTKNKTGGKMALLGELCVPAARDVIQDVYERNIRKLQHVNLARIKTTQTITIHPHRPSGSNVKMHTIICTGYLKICAQYGFSSGVLMWQILSHDCCLVTTSQEITRTGVKQRLCYPREREGTRPPWAAVHRTPGSWGQTDFFFFFAAIVWV